MLRAPLREKVAHFKILDPAAAAHFHPCFELVKAEGISVLARDGNIYKLHRGALTADFRIERRRKQRGEHAVHAVFARRAQKIFRYAPVFVRKRLKTVVPHQAICVKPIRVNERLLRQGDRQNFDLCTADCRFAFTYAHRELQFVLSGRKLFAADFEPNDVPAIIFRGAEALRKRRKQIGIFGFIFGNIEVVRFFGAFKPAGIMRTKNARQ